MSANNTIIDYTDHHPNDDQSLTALAQDLYTNGIAVLTDTWLSQNIQKHEAAFDAMIAAMPEFKGEPTQHVFGSFSALGNPSSFHNPYIRQVRQWTMSHTVPLLQQYQKLIGENYNLEQLPDRVLYRPSNVTPDKESWHRDESDANPADAIFGGWLNFNQQPQYFSCVLGSHLLKIKAGEKGFNLLTPEEKAHYAKSPSRRRIVIPPGALLIFNETIVHEIIPLSRSHPIKRLFMGWRLTQESHPLNDQKDKFITQAPLRLKTGQYPPMYSVSKNLTPDDQRAQLSFWSQNSFIDQCLETLHATLIVHRFMHGLAHYNLPLYPPYTDDELQLYTPNKSWRVLVPGSDTQYYDLVF